MKPYILTFQEIDKTKVALVGGKGANLGELFRIEGIEVPEGFCITTDAYKEIVGSSEEFNSLLGQLAILKADDRRGIAEISGPIRKVIEEIVVPKEIENEITRHLEQSSDRNAYAVRSSATAEDLPHASFAGQQDSYLNVIGKEAILKHIRKCWASLFTDRAVVYRTQNGFDHRQVYLAVVVQKMVYPHASGILFTADPITSNRKLVSIDAGFGLGEALVSGVVSADYYKVREDEIVDKFIAAKKLAIYPLTEGGTETRQIDNDEQNSQTLTDEQILQLARLGRQIEAHFEYPQDIEWCLVDDKFYVVQSRPITTLFPIPATDDQEKHVFVSVGHQQMMTDPIKPLGLSMRQLTSFGAMSVAAGRQFVDVASYLASSAGRKTITVVMGQHDPLIKDGLMKIIEQEFISLSPSADDKVPSHVAALKEKSWDELEKFENDSTIVSELITLSQSSVAELKQNIRTKSGPELFDFLLEDFQLFKKVLFNSQVAEVINTGVYTSSWINKNMSEWLGEKNAIDTLSQSAPNNITAEMGLELLDVADVIRPYPEVIEYLQHVRDGNFLDELPQFAGGQQVRDAIRAYLDKYGMRCAGEIDITKTRWSENPAILVPMILGNIKKCEPYESKRRFEQGLQQARRKEQELLARLEELPEGKQKAVDTKRMISLMRNLIGYREYPKYGIVSRYFVYKQALLKEAEQLLQAGVIHGIEDVSYLTFAEFSEAVRTQQVDPQIIRFRKDEHQQFEKLTPPRVITSDGEIVAGKYNLENLPEGAIVGLAVSAGVIEGRARVILNMEDANLEDGDILVTAFTDPSWTPLFISIKGLVTEVGGLMTHGAVIAREYGLPAVVGAEDATKLIKDGQRIRVNGTDGYVEVLVQ